jgi:hypothetical protein
MKLKDVLNLINSAHTIRIQEEVTDFNEPITRNTVYHTIKTTMYGNTVFDEEETLLNREVYCIFPVKNELVVYLKNEEVK